MRKNAWLAAAGLLLLGGCSPLNTLQTPDVRPPGGVLVGMGLTAGASGNVIEGNRENNDLPFTHTELYLRLGLLPGVEAGARVVGLVGYALDAKVQLLREPLLVAANAGFGRASEDYCFYGCAATNVSTRFAGLIAGTRHVYGALKLTDYAYRFRGGPDDAEAFEQLLPGLAFGVVNRASGSRVQLVLEANAYFMPEPAYTFSAGLQIVSD